jgi:hypothetical protein
VIVLFLLSIPGAVFSFAAGSGTPGDLFQIMKPKQLAAVRFVANLDKHFILI